MGILHKVKNYLFKKSLHLYFALFHSQLLNCVTIWFSTYQTYKAPISKLQDRAIKLLYGKHAHHYAPSSIYKSLNTLQLHDFVKSEMGLFVYITSKICSLLHSTISSSNSGVGNYFTRRARFGKTAEAAGRTLIGKQGEDLFLFGDHVPRTNVISKIKGFHLVFYSRFAPLRLIF